VSLPLPGGGTLLLAGKADKVDQDADGRLYVTDIKTGGASSYQGLCEDDPVLGGSKLQLPVYAHAARARHGTPATEVEAAYWFVRKDKGRKVVPLSPAVEQVYAETLETIVTAIRDGLFPQRPPATADFSWVQCHFCNPDGVGHGEARRRWELIKTDERLNRLVALIEPLD
jgi:RecB family exonuclease